VEAKAISERDGDEEFVFPESSLRVITNVTAPIVTTMRATASRYRREVLSATEGAC